jgi:Big-like domain-containing protein
VSVTVTCVADPVTILNSDGPLDYTENDPATAIDPAVTIDNPDLIPITAASVEITANLQAGEDVLAWADNDATDGIVEDATSGAGEIVLTGTGTAAEWAAALAAVTYTNASEDPSTLTRTVTFAVTAGATVTDTIDITVEAVDDPPVANDDTATVTEDDPATPIPVLTNDTDVDLGPKTIVSPLTTPPANGQVVVAADGLSLTYQPNPNYCNSQNGGTPDTFTYTLSPGDDTAQVSVTVTCVPDPATIVNSAGPLVYTENNPATAIDPGVTINNPDGVTVTAGSVSITTDFQTGQDVLDWVDNNAADAIVEGASTAQTVLLTGNGNAVQYAAALAAVTYTNTSENPSTLTRTVTFGITAGAPATDTINITVNAVDDPPVANNDAATVTEDDPAAAIPVLANDTDVDGGPKTIVSPLTTPPANDTVVIAADGLSLTYRPNADYCNSQLLGSPDTFTYAVTPGGDTAIVSITVTCINDPPVAGDDSFSGANAAVGNTTLVVDDPSDPAPTVTGPNKSISGDILANDADNIDGPGPLVVVAGTFATNDGGSVTIQADGDFVYTPAAGTSCTDTSDFFDYTVSDQFSPTAGTDIGRVTISIADCVWYVSNNAAGNAGTSTAPFDTLAQAETASAAGHTIFVFDGDNTTTGYAAGITLKANQVLTSEAVNLVVDGATLWTGVAANRPTITDNNADVIELADGNTVTGVDIDSQGTGGGIAGGDGDASGLISSVNVVDTAPFGTQPGLELDGTGGTWSVFNFTVSTNGAIGVRLNNAGTFIVPSAGTFTITVSGARGLEAAGASTSFGTASVIDAITVTGSGTGAVGLTATTGSLTLGDGVGTDLNLTTTSGATAALLSTHTGTLTVNAAGTDDVSATGGPAIDVTNAATLDFDAVSSTNSSTDGINLDSFGAGTFTALSGTIAGATGIAFDLAGGNGTVTYPGNINNGSGLTSVEITGRNGGTVTLSGQIADTNDAGGGINLTGNTGGSTIIGGTSKVLNTGASAAVTFTTSNGHTLNLTGGNLDIDTTSGQGINADDAGTIAVTGTGNTITTTTGIAITISNTDIGATGVTFQSISAGTAASGPPNAIVLNNTGTGNFTVTGTGTANSGGTLQRIASSPGAEIQGGTGAIDLTNANGTKTFAFMNIFAPSGNSLMVLNSTGSTVMQNSTIDHNSAVIANSFAVRLENHSGTATLTLNGVTVQNKMDGGTAISVSTQDTASATFNVQDSTFTNLFGSGIVVGAGDNAGANGTVNVNVTNTDFINAAVNGINDLEMAVQQNAVLNFNVSNNLFDNVGRASAIVGVINVNATGSGQIGSAGNAATISGNTIQHLGTSANVVDLGYLPIRVAPDNSAAVTHRLMISNNTLLDTWRQGMIVSARGQAILNLRVNNNTVGTQAEPVGQSNRRGVELETQQSGVLNVEVLNNASIVNSGTSNSNSALSLRSGADTPSNATINATVVGNTIGNTNAANTGGRFRAETIAITPGPGNLCLDLRNNALENATKEFNLQNQGLAGSVLNLNQSGNTGTITQVGTIGSVASCPTPSF